MRIFTVVAVVWALAAGVSTAQQSSPPSAAPPKAKAPAATPKSAEARAPAVPHPNQLMILIRSTLLAANHANLTGNYTVLRELGTPDFQQTNNSARLAEIFRDLRNKNIDLSPIAVLDAKLVRQPSINSNGQLRLSGFFPSRPEQVNFDLAFIMMGGRWRLHGMALNTTRNETPSVATGEPAQPPPAASASKPEAVKKPTAAATDGATPPNEKTPSETKASPAPTRPQSAD
jgi:hypothetical protein